MCITDGKPEAVKPGTLVAKSKVVSSNVVTTETGASTRKSGIVLMDVVVILSVHGNWIENLSIDLGGKNGFSLIGRVENP